MELSRTLLDKYCGQKSFEFAAELCELMTEKNFTLSNIGSISNRVMHNWVKEGLVPGFEVIHKPSEKDSALERTRKWHRFSFVDYVWLRIIIELRRFDVSFELIKKIKNDLLSNIELSNFLEFMKGQEEALEKFVPADKKDEFHAWIGSPSHDEEIALIHSKLNFLFFLIIDTVVHKEAISLIINQSGKVHPYSLAYYDGLKDDEKYKQAILGHHISISLNSIIAEFISNSNELGTEVLRLKLLTEQEIKIINLIRRQKIQELTIRFDEKSEPVMIELTSINKVSIDTRLLDLIYQHGYHSIKCETADGQVMHCRNTRKVKL